MKTRAALTLVGSFAAISIAAGSVSAGATPKLSLNDLPESKTPAVVSLDKKPTTIPAESTIAELHVDAQPGAPSMPQAQGLSGFASKGASAAPLPPRQVTVSGAIADACISVPANGREAFRTTQVFLDSTDGVLPVRIESLKETPAGAELAIVDAWVDPTTRGAKEIQRSTIALRKTASGPIGASAYSYRSGSTVSVVLPSGMNAQFVDSEGRFVSTSCQIARGELKVEQGKGSTLNGTFTRMTTAIEGKDGQNGVPSMAIRFALSASASQLSADPSPLLSVQLRALDEIPKAARDENHTQQALVPSL